MKKSVFSRAASLAVAAAMVVTSCLTDVTSKAADSYSYKIEGRTPEQIMGSYGLVALDSIYINAHCHSNFLVKILNNNANSGLNNSGQYQPYNESEEFYFYDYGDLNNSQLSNSEKLGWLYIGSAVTETGRRSNAVELKNSAGRSGEISKPGPDHIIFDADEDKPYADMDSIANLMKGYNRTIADMAEIGDVSVDFTDQNARTVSCPSGNSVAKLNADELGAGKTSIVFSVDQTDAATSAVFNIDLAGKTEVNLDELVIAYGSRSNQIGNRESNATSNHNRIYYNFYDSSQPDYQYTGKINFNGRGFGTIIAPSADVTLSQNWDGIVVAEKVTIGAEFHRIVNPIGAPKSDVEGDTANATLEFSKEEAAEKELAGAELSLTIESGDLSGVRVVSGSPVTLSSDKRTVSWTSGTVPTKLTNLIAGEYTWKETAAPNGYEYATDVKFKVDENGRIYRYIGDGAYSNTPMGASEKLIMVDYPLTDPDTPDDDDPADPDIPGGNDPVTPDTPGGNDPVTPDTPDGNDPVTPDTPAGTGNLKVIVYDEKTNEVVPNATVVITYPDGVTQKTDITDSNGEISFIEIPAGEYTVVTTEVPDGYTVTAGKEHKAVVVVDETTVLEVLINTDTDTGSLIITVYDETTNAVVPNATVTVTYPDGTKSPYITDSEGKITLSNVPVGKYVTETTKVPDGYTVTVGKTYETTVVANQTSECKIYIVTDKTDISVRTGDAFKVFPLIVIMTVALFGIVIMIVKRRRHGE